MTAPPDERRQLDSEQGLPDTWLKVCLGLVDAPSLAELESRLDRALADLCRPQRWMIAFDLGAGVAEPSWEGSQPPELQHAAVLTLPLRIGGRDHGKLEIVPAPEQPIPLAVVERLSPLSQALAAGLHRLHLELHSLAHTAELAFVQALLQEHLPVSRLEASNSFSEAILSLLGGSSFGAIIPSSQSEGSFWSFSTRRACVTLSPKQRQRLMKLVEAMFVKSGNGQHPFVLAELDEVQHLAETYRLSYLSRWASLAIMPVHQGNTLLGALLLGEERHPKRHPLARQALAACKPLARAMAQAITRDRVLRTRIDHGPFMRALIDQLDEGLLTVEQGTISSWNRTASKLFGYRADEVLGKPLDHVLHAAPPGLIKRSGTIEPSTTAQGSLEWKMRTADGQELLLDCIISTLDHHQTGEPIMMYTFREVGRERELEHLKDELLSGISHELRTPLNNINSFARLLQERPELPEEVRRVSLQLVQSSTEQLNRMIEDFIDVARARRGHLPVVLEPVRIDVLIRSIIREVRPQYPRHTIMVRSEKELPAVYADHLRVKQIVDNLIGNAATYSAKGTRIYIRVRRYDDAVAISVSDQGIGIVPEAQDQIFEPFYRAENSRRFRAKGVGLGLSIVRSLVQAHGGQVTVRSVVGRGTIFTFTLPTITTEDMGD